MTTSPTPVGHVIQPGQDIPADVTAMIDKQGDTWVLVGDRWRLRAHESLVGEVPAIDMLSFRPYTVTAVREPEPPAREADVDLTPEQQCGSEETHGGHRWRDDAAPLPGWRWCDGFVGRAGVPAASPALVLSLPEVPDGTVALDGPIRPDGTRQRYVRHGQMWREAPDGRTWTLAELLESYESVSVVMREPRTWPRLDEVTEPPALVEVDGLRFRRSGDVYIEEKTGGMWGWWALRQRGDVREVLDGGEAS